MKRLTSAEAGGGTTAKVGKSNDGDPVCPEVRPESGVSSAAADGDASAAAAFTTAAATGTPAGASAAADGDGSSAATFTAAATEGAPPGFQGT